MNFTFRLSYLLLFVLLSCSDKNDTSKVLFPINPNDSNASCDKTDKAGSFIFSITEKGAIDNIRVHRMTSATTVDAASVQDFPSTYFNSPSIIPASFYGIAYHNNFLYITGKLNNIYRVGVTFNSGSVQLSKSWSTIQNTGLPAAGGGSLYYLNNNISDNHLFTGELYTGVLKLDLNNWSPSGFESLKFGSSGSKSAVQIGSKVFVSLELGGVFRMDDMLGTNKTNSLLIGETDSLTSDGTFLFGNDYASKNGKLHKWLPAGTGSNLSLIDQDGLGTWNSPDLEGRVRGVSYDRNCLYVSPGGSGTNRNLYAIDSISGEVFDMGAAAESVGAVYGVIVVNP